MPELRTDDEIVVRDSISDQVEGQETYIKMSHFRWGCPPDIPNHQRIVLRVKNHNRDNSSSIGMTITEAIQLQDALWRYIQEATAAEEST